MEQHHRRQFEYLFHLGDDDDLEEAMLVLTGQYDRRNPEQRFHMIGDRRQHPLALTRRLMIIITICMAVVSTTSLAVARLAPEAALVVPGFFIYCATVVLVRARMKEDGKSMNV